MLTDRLMIQIIFLMTVSRGGVVSGEGVQVEIDVSPLAED